MKATHSIKQKTKVAVLLFCIMVCTILIRILEDHSIKNMGNAFTSLYNDRLIPATDLFYISESIYAKRFLIENHLNATAVDIDLVDKLNKHDIIIDSLLKKYEQTFLVKNEKNHLIQLKNKLIENKNLETKILNIPIEASSSTLLEFNKTANKSYQQIFENLTALTKIQTKVGEELIKESKSIIAGTNIYSNIQLLLAVVIGILIVSIMFTSNVIKVKQEKFNLN
jgi:Four helix bundle sensory module for signal transduction